MEKNYSLVSVANMLGIKVRTARQWVHDGKIKAMKYPHCNLWFVSQEELNRIMGATEDVDKG